MPRGYTVAWSHFTEPVPGCFLAGSTKITAWSGLALPKDGKDYKQAVKDGKPVLTPGGDKAIDFSQTTLKRFGIVDTTMTTSRLQVNHLGSERLCGTAYPAGTIVEDRTKGEVYQLGGLSPAVDAKLKKMLEDPTKGTPKRDRPLAQVSGSESRVRLWLLVGNVVCVIALAVGYIWYHRRGRHSPEVAKPEEAKLVKANPDGDPGSSPGA